MSCCRRPVFFWLDSSSWLQNQLRSHKLDYADVPTNSFLARHLWTKNERGLGYRRNEDLCSKNLHFFYSLSRSLYHQRNQYAWNLYCTLISLLIWILNLCYRVNIKLFQRYNDFILIDTLGISNFVIRTIPACKNDRDAVLLVGS
jgi:hypothetical protein